MPKSAMTIDVFGVPLFVGVSTGCGIAAAGELEEALFGREPPRCAKQPNERCLPGCEYGLAGPCQRSVTSANRS